MRRKETGGLAADNNNSHETGHDHWRIARDMGIGGCWCMANC